MLINTYGECEWVTCKSFFAKEDTRCLDSYSDIHKEKQGLTLLTFLAVLSVMEFVPHESKRTVISLFCP